MLICDDTMFIHVPKVGGMSATAWMINNLDGRILLFIPKRAHDHARAMIKFDDIHGRLELLPGGRHEMIPKALEKCQQWTLARPKTMFSFIRPAADLVSSYYHYILKPAVAERMTQTGLLKDLETARKGNLKAFARTCEIYGKGPHRLMNFYKCADPNVELDIVPLHLAGAYLNHRFKHHKNAGRLPLERRNTSRKTQLFDDETIAIINLRYANLNQAYAAALAKWEPILAK